jgi:lysophospholipase L1-like esterase
MAKKNIFLAITLIFSFGCVLAQQKKSESVNNKNAGVTFFPADSTIQPASTSIIVYTEAGPGDQADKLITILNKKGVAAAKAGPGNNELNKAVQYLQTNAAAHKITAPKIGVLTVGAISRLPLTQYSPDFIAMINPGAISKNSVSSSVPLFIDENNENTESITRFYAARSKAGGKTDLHLHQQPVSDSVQASELVSWMDGFGLLKPISTEKTKAQQKREDWANFMKMIEDRLHNDWPWLKRYEVDNDKMPAPAKGEKRVIFLGNSITENWIDQDPEFFKTHNYINRGIGGQTTPQMLVRFREDVVNLHPQVVIILAGINDIAQNTGPSRIENVAGNIISMAEIAKAHNINVIFCSVLPAAAIPWRPGVDPVPLVIKLNAMLKDYAEKNKLEYVDYYSAVVDEKRAFKKDLAIDGLVHPNLAGYKIMEPLAEAAINKVLEVK